MELLNLAGIAGVYTLMLVILIAAVAMVTLRSLFHSALALAAVLIGIAGIYLTLQADFLAMIQILIYVGAVMTLIIFAVMLTEHLSHQTVRQNNRQSPLAIAGICAFLFCLTGVIVRTPWPLQPQNQTATITAMELGKAFMGQYVFAFELISVFLIAALIGAIVIARKDK
ncbi:MAG: NADH-quinone oxidoreductase subunit J [Candidatus Omnitrophica bacterium]|nr:NADH-quinone oxidoreductase subunit J [Candidatus Omnitrophota bacterium]MDD5670281.1 NADH-quinone oxidoreductase subunit J [Candidatus Omnitrophota bacterium]